MDTIYINAFEVFLNEKYIVLGAMYRENVSQIGARFFLEGKYDEAVMPWYLVFLLCVIWV